MMENKIEVRRRNGELIGSGDTVRQVAEANRANLRGADLSNANLSHANLRGANLSHANLRGAYLRGAYLIDAVFNDANLIDAVFNDADLSGANFGELYEDIPVTLEEAASVILDHRERLRMSCWHSDSEWRNGKAKQIHECNTCHCIAGFAHQLACLNRPELLDANVYLVGRLALGEEAASHFFDDDDTALTWLESVVAK